MGVDPNDQCFKRQTHKEEIEENREWLTKRDNMASAMCVDYSI
ncbi:hypothetical protein CFOL_v3_33600 [Cephalotus follicularis]|uniref:Uncharacterized protein n=1 Tax=Cephalotus follicularis TaxID=3775 RepID=A0A1Q3DCK2_CEPFO|nr:hypothetical protein CFOL_v3_33600 [Cephalotus follicularis]